MARRSLERQLPSVHYDIGVLEDFIEIITESSNNSDIQISVDWDNISMTFESIEDLVNSPKVPKFVRDFSVHIWADEGTVHLIGGDTVNSSHKVTVAGEDGWVRKLDSNIKEFAENRIDILGNLKGYLTKIQYVLVGFFIFLYHDQLTAIFVSFFSIDAPLSYHLRAGAVLGIIALLQLPKWLYPYVVLEIESGSLFYKEIISYLSITSTIIVSIAGILQIFGLI